MYVQHVCGMPQKQEGGLEPLELESQTAASHQVGAGNQTEVLLKEQSGFLTADLSLQPQSKSIFI